MARVIYVKSARRHHQCENCDSRILPGKPYKHVSLKTGPRSSYKRVRCESCPTWKPWDLSSALWARLEQVAHDFHEELKSATDESEVHDALTNAAECVRDIAEEKRESASNIEDGFGHPTSTSDELNEIADSLESWADDIEAADVPEFPEFDCDDCDGIGEINGSVCVACDGNGQHTPEELNAEQLESWISEVTDALSIVDEAPV